MLIELIYYRLRQNRQIYFIVYNYLHVRKVDILKDAFKYLGHGNFFNLFITNC